ncbi:MAG: SRPBCC domain-containing protein [Bacteroidales bacterium]|jgi:uncharacterized protein YndB with AHSA1/START domain
MSKIDKRFISVRAEIEKPVEKVWRLWTNPGDIVKWNFASDDWQTSRAVNDLRAGGEFNYRMEARDGSTGFDFIGIYDIIICHRIIFYTAGDGRKVEIFFSEQNGKTEVIESFEAEGTHPVEFQRQGWQSILNNFKRYAESS